MDRFHALLFCAAVASTPVVAGTVIFDRADNDKYQFMSGGSVAGASWAGGIVPWYYVDTNRPAGITKEATLARLNMAMAKWSAVCGITFPYGGELTGAQIPAPEFSDNDGKNIVGWATGDPDVVAPTSGVTYVTWSGSPGGNFRLTNADIKLNADYGVGFDATLTHEVGHMLGLHHSDHEGQVMSGPSPTPPNPPSTMYTGLTELGPDDIAGCVALYGVPGGGGPPPPYFRDGDYSDLWWAGASEDGWGVTLSQHGETIFLAWYIYDSQGFPLWVVMPGGAWNSAHDTYTGTVYIPNGSWFGAYDASHFVVNAPAGNVSIHFDSATQATLAYNVRGLSGTKTVTRQVFGTPNTAPITNYTDIWWGGTVENGWGIVLAQQYHDIFAAWYTYDSTGKPTWLVMPGGTWTSSNTYTGALFRTRSAPVLGTKYDPSSFVVTQAGTLTFTFSSANAGTVTYTLDGITQTKPISRQPF